MEQAPTPQLLKFGPYLVDLAAGEVRKNGHRIRLQKNPLQVLALLAEKQGQVVTREELRKRLWPEDTFVDFENGLNAAVSKLRDALSDGAENPRYIETIPRRGYRFLFPVEAIPANGNGVKLPAAPATDIELSQAPIVTKAAIAIFHATPSAIPWWRNMLALWKPLLLTGIVSASLLTFAAYKVLNRRPAINLANMQITKLTDSGKVQQVSVSPEGRYIVYDQVDGELQSLWVRNVATKSDVQVLSPDVVDFSGVSFSPDGNYIYFTRADKTTANFRYLYVMPVLGGTPRLLIRDVDGPVSFSPYGSHFAFQRSVPERNSIEIRIANSDGTGDRLLASLPVFNNFDAIGVAWSPDGKTIVAPFLRSGKETTWSLVAINAADGTVRDVFSGPEWIGRPAWLPDGKTLLVPIGNLQENRTQLLIVSYPSGEKRRFTNDLSEYSRVLELTKDGRMLVTLENRLTSHIWTLPQGDSTQAKQITSGETADTGVVPGPGAKLLVQSRRSDLVLMNSDGSQRTLLRPGTRNYTTMSSCGERYLIFDTYEENRVRLMRTDVDGSNPLKLADELDTADCSPDGTWAIYVSANKLYRLPIGGGAPTLIVSPSAGNYGAISPDGKWIAYSDQTTEPVPASNLAVIPATGGSPVHVFDLPMGGDGLRWSPDQKGLEYLLTRNGATNVWEQPLSGGAPHQVTNFTSGSIFDFSWTRDGKQLLLAKGEKTSDVVLISNFR